MKSPCQIVVKQLGVLVPTTQDIHYKNGGETLGTYDWSTASGSWLAPSPNFSMILGLKHQNSWGSFFFPHETVRNIQKVIKGEIPESAWRNNSHVKHPSSLNECNRYLKKIHIHIITKGQNHQLTSCCYFFHISSCGTVEAWKTSGRNKFVGWKLWWPAKLRGFYCHMLLSSSKLWIDISIDEIFLGQLSCLKEL